MNLESEIYKLSFELSEKIDVNDLQKLLGILSNDGVYAMWIYAKDKFKKNKEQQKNDRSKENKDQQKDKIDIINYLVKELGNFVKGNKKDDENIDNKYFQDLAQDLNKLLFMKELLEKVLIYAIYHAKAKGDKNGEKN
jgi:NTP pyrophosphatase (non-canonical NTP hydrolase)